MLGDKLKRGFTLVELVTVIGMIGLIATYSLTRLNHSRERARDVVRAGDVRNLSKAVETYFSTEFVFPDDLSQVSDIFAEGLPRDPRTGEDYLYVKSVSSKGYCLGAVMETTTEQNDVDCGATGANYQLQGP